MRQVRLGESIPSGLFLSRYPAVDERFGHWFRNIGLYWEKMKVVVLLYVASRL